MSQTPYGNQYLMSRTIAAYHKLYECAAVWAINLDEGQPMPPEGVDALRKFVRAIDSLLGVADEFGPDGEG